MSRTCKPASLTGLVWWVSTWIVDLILTPKRSDGLGDAVRERTFAIPTSPESTTYQKIGE
jgi:hypothetical protein